MILPGELSQKILQLTSLELTANFLYRCAVVIRTPVHGSHILCIPSGTNIKYFFYSL